jgi:RNA polymerase primary sigma factor
MPRVARFRIAAVADLCRQLSYAPAAARRRHMEAAERLVGEIDPARVYPRDFVMYRVTGYRPERADPQGLVGEALAGDLAEFVARLSRGLDLPVADEVRAAVPIEVAAAGLGVCARTLHRYRRQGLACHYVVFPDGVKRLAVYRDALDRFLAGHADQVGRAARFSRIDAATAQAIDADAAAPPLEDLSPAAAARRLAPRYGRSPEALRLRLLRRRRERGGGAPEPIRPRDLRTIWRAARSGEGAGDLAQRLRKAVPSIHRALNRARRAMLLRLDLRGAEAWTPEGDEAAAILDDPQVRRGLPPPVIDLDAIAFIEGLRAAPPHDPGAETRTAAAFAALRAQAARAIPALPAYPASAALDELETGLRWAAVLKRRLVGWALPAALRSAEQFLGRRLDQLPAEEILAMLRRMIGVAAAAVEGADAQRHRVAQRSAYAMSVALAAGARPAPARAATRHRAGSVVLARPFERLCPWQRWLDLPAPQRARLARLPEALREIVAARYGLAGERPRTAAQVAAASGRTPAAVSRLVARAIAELRE